MKYLLATIAALTLLAGSLTANAKGAERAVPAVVDCACRQVENDRDPSRLKGALALLVMEASLAGILLLMAVHGPALFSRARDEK